MTTEHRLRLRFLIVLTLGLCATAACSGNQRHQRRLLTNAIAVCDPHAAHFVLNLPAGGGFSLNTAPEDSARVAEFIQGYLPRMPESRLFMIQVDSARQGELTWIIDAVERSGRSAYVLDKRCLTRIP